MRAALCVDHGQADVSFHRHPGGDVLFPLPVEAFGFDPQEAFVEWSGGYLAADLAVVTLGGDGQDEAERFRHHLTERAHEPLSAEAAVEVTNTHELVPLGDNFWLTDGPGGNPGRWSRTALPSSPPHPEG